MPQIRKAIYTLNVNNYAPDICALTYPLLRAYAKKIGADFHLITERKFPGWPIVYEKLQIHELGRDYDWNMFIDSDALVSPEMFDVTEHIGKNTVCHNGRDMAGIRWKYDQYFRRDGRHIGSCNWFTVGSDWCLDLWRPLDDLTLEEAVSNINITIGERNSGFCHTDHLIDDYTLSRNIARFGLKVETVTELCGRLGWRSPLGQPISPFFYHKYTISNDQKIQEMLAILSTPNGQPCRFGTGWGLMTPAAVTEYLKKWRPASGLPGHVDRTTRVAIDSTKSPNGSGDVPGSHIEGRMSAQGLHWLHSTAKCLTSVVAVGPGRGRSAFALCSSGCPTIFVVDSFAGDVDHLRTLAPAMDDQAFAAFRANILDCFRNVVLKQMTNAEAATDFLDGAVDMVFLEGILERDAVS